MTQNNINIINFVIMHKRQHHIPNYNLYNMHKHNKFQKIYIDIYVTLLYYVNVPHNNLMKGGARLLTVNINKQGRIVIPVAIIRLLKITEQDSLSLSLEGNKIVIEKLQQAPEDSTTK